MSVDDPDAQRAVLLHALRELPDRKAPLTLQDRVLKELARRAAQPWWQRGYAAWPVPARMGFVTLCGTLVLAQFLGGFYEGAGVTVLDIVVQRLSLWMIPALGALSALAAPAVVVAHSIPAVWLDVLLAVTALLYGVLFGISAAAYHVFSIQPSRTWGDRS